jgi:chromosome segregation ATPase
MSSSSFVSLFLVFAVMGLSQGNLLSDDASSTATELRLRDAVREARGQLSDAQNQVVSLQAAKDQADKDNADLKTKVDDLSAQVAALTKQGADDKTASDKAIAELTAQAATQATQIAQLTEALANSKNACNQANKLAAEQQAARAQLALQNALLQRLVDDREMKNLELYKTGTEILTRYEKFSLGEALDAKEPFAGQSRLKLESLVQDYKGKLLKQTVDFGPTSNSVGQRTVQPGSGSSPPAKT